MIFTECPYCDEPQLFDLAFNGRKGYFPSRCKHCNNVMWVENSTIGGYTRTHENFRKELTENDDKLLIEKWAKMAIDNSNI